MINFEKYFGTPEKAAETLEKLSFGSLTICEDFCKLYSDCSNVNTLTDDYDCCDGIKYFLIDEEGNVEKCQETQK